MVVNPGVLKQTLSVLQRSDNKLGAHTDVLSVLQCSDDKLDTVSRTVRIPSHFFRSPALAEGQKTRCRYSRGHT